MSSAISKTPAAGRAMRKLGCSGHAPPLTLARRSLIDRLEPFARLAHPGARRLPLQRRRPPAPKLKPPKPPRGRRLAAADREQAILAGAIRYFAEVGFKGRHGNSPTASASRSRCSTAISRPSRT